MRDLTASELLKCKQIEDDALIEDLMHKVMQTK